MAETFKTLNIYVGFEDGGCQDVATIDIKHDWMLVPKDYRHSIVEEALDLARRYGGIDGSHHKDWVIDQMVRSLITEEEYMNFVTDAKAGEDGPETYEWSEGIAP